MAVAIEDIEARRQRIRLPLAHLCRQAGVDYQVAYRGVINGRIDPDAVIRLDAELARVEDELRAALLKEAGR